MTKQQANGTQFHEVARINLATEEVKTERWSMGYQKPQDTVDSLNLTHPEAKSGKVLFVNPENAG